MIEKCKKTNVYSYLITEIYCCDCFFERVMSLINSSKEFTACDEFINILENEFSRKFIILLFGGKIVLLCRELIKFVLKIKKENEKIRKRHCLTDQLNDGNEIIEICTICFIKIIQDNKLFTHFKLKTKSRNDYIFL